MTGAAASGRSVWIFLALTCLLSWPVWVASGVLPRGGTGAYDARWLVAQIGVFGPSLAALIISATLGPERLRSSLRALPIFLLPLALPGLLVARASPPGVAAFPPDASVAAVAVAGIVGVYFSCRNRGFLGPATGEPQPRPDGRWLLLSAAFMPALFLGAWTLVHLGGGDFRILALEGGLLRAAWTLLVCLAHNLLLGGSLGEEIGWRGFLLPELMKRTPPLAASFAVGLAWGLWHLPVDVYVGFGLTGAGAVLGRVLYAIPLSVLFTWIFLGSRGSVLCALLLHTSLNVMGDLGLSRYEATERMVVLFVVAAAVVVAVRSRVFREARAGPPGDPPGPVPHE